MNFYLEEQAGNLNYFGYLDKVDFGKNMYGLTNVFTWNNQKKPIGGGFIGTPPELDIAVYSLCALTRSSMPCPAVFNGINFNVVSYINDFNGHQTIGTAYPEF